ncbi:MAG: hypothetical protein M3P22_01240, partial [bacterium]|nr:hypothetical protein [bacterium]
MQDKIKNLIKEALGNLDIVGVEQIMLEHPVDISMGDYSTNVAMILAKKMGTNPKELAEKIAGELLALLKGEAGRGYTGGEEIRIEA